MYGQDLQQGQISGDQPKLSVAQNIKEQFQQLNDRQTKVIIAIADKLHDLVNKRQPPQSEQKISAGERQVDDFNSMLLSELDKMKVNANRLEDIYSHLQSII